MDVTFDQTVAVTGTPNLALTIGSTARQATGSHVSGQSKITFSYTVATSDRDTDGISIAAAALTPNGATPSATPRARTRGSVSAPTPSSAPAGHKVSAPPRVAEVRLDTTVLVHRPPGDVWGSQPSGWADPRQTATNRFAPAVVVAMVAFDQDFAVNGSGWPMPRADHRRPDPAGGLQRLPEPGVCNGPRQERLPGARLPLHPPALGLRRRRHLHRRRAR